MKSFDLNKMEDVINNIKYNKKIISDNKEKLIKPIREYCIQIKKWCNDELSKMIEFINKNSNLFYDFYPDANYYGDRIKSEIFRNWDMNETSVYIDNIELTVNPQSGKTTNINLTRNYQYNKKVCNHRSNKYNNYFDETNSDYMIDFWCNTKKGMDNLKDDIHHLINEFVNVINSIYKNDILMIEKVKKCQKEIKELHEYEEIIFLK